MKLLFCLCFITCSLFGQINLGLNLTVLGNANSQWMLNDAMKQSSGWFVRESGTLNFGTHVTDFDGFDLDSNGYPLQVPVNINGTDYEVHTLLATNQPAPWYYPSGDYTLVFEGTGQVQIDWDVNGWPEVYTNGGTYTVNIANPSSDGLELTILQSDSNDPIRNIHFILPGYGNNYTSQPFTNEFLNYIQTFGTLRFMKPLSVEDNPIQTWDQRTQRDYYTYDLDIHDTIRPHLPLEFITQLANDYDKNIWINIPYLADDNYVVNFAKFLKDSLESDVEVYVEYANEVWNQDYPLIFNYMVQQGIANNFGSNTIEHNSFYYTYRSIEIFEKFDSVFVGDTDRIHAVLATQAYDQVAGYVRDAYQDNTVNPNNYEVDYFSIAPYFAGEIIAHIEANDDICTWTAQRLVDSVSTSLIQNLDELIPPIVDIADDMGVPVVAYEGGHGLGQFRELSACAETLVDSANYHPDMETIYCRFFEYWVDSVGSGVMNSFVSAERGIAYGSYGIVNTVFQNFSDSPKWRAHDSCDDVITSEEITPVVLKNKIEYIGNNRYRLPENNAYVIDVLGKRHYVNVNNKVLDVNHLPPAFYIVSSGNAISKILVK